MAFTLKCIKCEILKTYITYGDTVCISVGIKVFQNINNIKSVEAKGCKMRGHRLNLHDNSDQSRIHGAMS